MSDAVLVSLFEHKAWCDRGMIETLRAAPADADRAQMTVALFTLDHTQIVDAIFRARLEGREADFGSVVAERKPVLDDLAERFAKTDAWYLDYVRGVTAAELGETVEFVFVADGEAGRMTKGEILAHVVTHGASHRGAINKMFEALKVQGAPDMVTTFLSRGRVVDSP
jgi:uncharacterized damage-inducible protein DinB